jgi:hypothetical protein
MSARGTKIYKALKGKMLAATVVDYSIGEVADAGWFPSSVSLLFEYVDGLSWAETITGDKVSRAGRFVNPDFNDPNFEASGYIAILYNSHKDYGGAEDWVNSILSCDKTSAEDLLASIKPDKKDDKASK